MHVKRIFTNVEDVMRLRVKSANVKQGWVMQYINYIVEEGSQEFALYVFQTLKIILRVFVFRLLDIFLSWKISKW